MGYTWDIERKVAGITLNHGEDEGRHRIDVTVGDGSTYISMTFDSYPQPTEEFLRKLETLLLVETSTNLAKQLAEKG